jgi:S-adenosylmethionine synthetase
VVVSIQHSEQVTLPVLRDEIMTKVVKEVIPDKYLDVNTKYHINPCGNFIIGGPMGDAGKNTNT